MTHTTTRRSARPGRSGSGLVALNLIAATLAAAATLPLTPVPAAALTVSDCTPDVTLDDGTQVGGDTDYVVVSTVDSDGDGTDDECVLRFIKPSEEMVWTLPDTSAMRLLVIAGGGGGSMGGGGAGGMYDSEATLSEASIAAIGSQAKIHVGSGGASQSLNVAQTEAQGESGQDSWFIGVNATAAYSDTSGTASASNGEAAIPVIVMKGGGGGGAGDMGTYSVGGSNTAGSHNDGISGGSSGGSGRELVYSSPTRPPTAPLDSDFGHQGGIQSCCAYGRPNGGILVGSGGGGAGSKGSNAVLYYPIGGTGGSGKVSDITGEDVTYAEGGGGAAVNRGDTVGATGGSTSHGGGRGGFVHGNPNGSVTSGGASGGQANTGSGAGGGGGAPRPGGSGVVIVRYLPPPVDPAPVLGSVVRAVGGFSAEITNLAAVEAVADSVAVSVSAGSVSRSGSTVTVSGLSTGESAEVTVTASASGFSPSSGSVTGVSRAGQASLSVTGSDSLRFGGSVTVAGSGGSGSGGLSFALVSGDCVFDADTRVLSSDGSGMTSCVVEVTRAGDANFVDSAAASGTFVIGKADRFVSFMSAVPSDPRAGDTYTPVATASGGLPVSFAVSGGCSIDGDGVVSFSSAGSCTITASSKGDGDANYSDASDVTQSIVVGLANQTVSFDAVGDRAFDVAPFQLSAVSSRGLPVTFSTSSAACSVTSSGVVSVVGVGLCEVTASQAGVDGEVAAASDVVRSFRVQPVVAGAPRLTSVGFGGGEVTVGFVPPVYVGGGTVSGFRAVASDAGGNSFVNNSCTASPCTVEGLANGTAYTVTVAAVNEAGVGPVSNVSPAVIPATAADAVGGLAAVPGDGTLDVSWTQPDSFGGGTFQKYVVTLTSAGAAVDGQGPVEIVDVDGAGDDGAVSTTFSGLDNGTAYDVKVVTISSANQEEIEGNTAEIVGVPAVVPGVVRSLSAELVGTEGALVSWVAPASDGGLPVSSFAVDPACTFENVTDTFCTLSGLGRGRTVTIGVAAVNGIGAGVPVTTTVTTPALPAPPAPEPEPVPEPAPARGPVVTGGTPGGPEEPGVPPRAPGGGPVSERPAGEVGGVPVPVTTVPADGGVTVGAGGVELTLAGTQGGTAGQGDTTRPALTTGEVKRVEGEGFAPGSTVEVWVPADAVGPARQVGTALADGSGGFRLDVDVFGGLPLPVGRNLVQIVGTTEQGAPLLLDVPFEVVQGDPAPELQRDTGELPDITGGPVVTLAGLPTDATVTPEPDTGRVIIESGPLTLTLTTDDRGTVAGTGASDVQLTTAATGPLTLTIVGARPGTRADVWAFSTPTLLTSVTVGEDGTATVTLTPDALDEGPHTLQVQTISPDGYTTAANLPLTITPEPAPEGPVTIQNTSTDTTSTPWTLIGLAPALTVLALTVLTRRRTTRDRTSSDI